MSCDIGVYNTCLRTSRDFSLRFIIKDGEGVAVSIASAKAQVRAHASATDVLIELPVVLGGETGEVLIDISAEETESLNKKGGFWDLQVTLDSGDVITPIGGSFDIEWGVTRG